MRDNQSFAVGGRLRVIKIDLNLLMVDLAGFDFAVLAVLGQ